jgi:hypothetical protein
MNEREREREREREMLKALRLKNHVLLLLLSLFTVLSSAYAQMYCV